jgi:D-alanyl-D-alanine carboxypeptidase (penicillin-binding protein 5/6)
VTAGEVAVVDDASGLMLYGASPHAHEAPASTTKIATAIVTFEHADSLDMPVHITVNGWAMAEADGSSIMGLSPGQNLTVRTLLDGLLLPSGNDAAEQLAISLADSRAEFVGWMNSVATDELGLQDTHFVNPSGLDADGHYSSAYDLAQLARRAMREDVFRKIVASPEIKTQGLDLVGHNPLIGPYPGADGVKTGTTDNAGKVLVGSATRNGHRVYAVVMHSDDIEADTTALLDWAFQEFQWS